MVVNHQSNNVMHLQSKDNVDGALLLRKLFSEDKSIFHQEKIVGPPILTMFIHTISSYVDILLQVQALLGKVAREMLQCKICLRRRLI